MERPHVVVEPAPEPSLQFIVDAQLPKRLAYLLREAGHDCLHTLDLLAANRTADETINALSLRDSRIVITKDTDFRDSFLLYSRPYKLLLVVTGNCPNAALLELLEKHLPTIIAAFQQAEFLELRWEGLITRR